MLVPFDEEKLQVSLPPSEVFRTWFWSYYDQFGFLLLLNLGWALLALGIAWLWSLIWTSPLGILKPFLIFFFVLSESVVSIGWAYGVFKNCMDRKSAWMDILDGYSFFWAKGMAVAGIFWLVAILGAFNLQFLWFHPLPHRILNYGLVIGIVWILIFWILIGFYLWPVLFFQNAPISKVFYRSFLLAWDSGAKNILYLTSIGILATVFTIFWPLWFFVGPTSIFALQSVALEKAFLKYKITFKDKDLSGFLENLERERNRTWREFLRPWEHR